MGWRVDPLRLAMASAAMAMFGTWAQAQPVKLAGQTCTTPPALHCPDKDCPAEMVTNGGSVVEPKTGRTFFLDFPCDLKKGEKVTFILSLHGGGSYGNWQRNYFPLIDQKDKYRLVIATPFSPTRVWAPTDDVYLQNIVSQVTGELGNQNIKAFWLAGHSWGGMTSRRVICSDYFKDKVDGWISLSGSRIGAQPAGGPSGGRPIGGGAPGGAAAPAQGPTGGPARPAAAAAGPGGLPADAMAALGVTPACDFSFIYENGEHEMGGQPIPTASPWAEKYACGPRTKKPDVVDTKPGYVYDGTRLAQNNKAWGLLPRGGKAEIFEFPKCKDGKVVADVVRVDKGHTEGLEPKITEELVKLMLSAKGGKLQKAS